MSAFNARKSNPFIGEFYRRLVSRGKTFKQAMTACMRELLVLMKHAGGSGPGLGPNLRDLIAPSEAWHGSVGEAFRLDVP